MPATPRSASAPGAGTTAKLNDAPATLSRLLFSQYVPALSIVVKLPLADAFEDPPKPAVLHPDAVIGELQPVPVSLPKRRLYDPLQIRVISCVPVTVKDLFVWT